MPTNSDQSDGLALTTYLLTGATWQDSLLQSYRTIHLTMQSIFIVIGVGLTTAMLTVGDLFRAIALFVVFIALLIFGLWSLKTMRGVIMARGHDVSFWHRKIIAAESHLNTGKKVFTEFKIHQKLRRDDSEYFQALLKGTKAMGEEDISRLIGGGLGHTRKAIDVQLGYGLVGLWAIMFLVSLAALLRVIHAASTHA